MNEQYPRIPKHARSDHAGDRFRLPTGARRRLGRVTAFVLAGLAAALLVESANAAPQPVHRSVVAMAPAPLPARALLDGLEERGQITRPASPLG